MPGTMNIYQELSKTESRQPSQKKRYSVIFPAKHNKNEPTFVRQKSDHSLVAAQLIGFGFDGWLVEERSKVRK